MVSAKRFIRPAGLLSLAGLAVAGAFFSPSQAPATPGDDPHPALPSPPTPYGPRRDIKGSHETGGVPGFPLAAPAGARPTR